MRMASYNVPRRETMPIHTTVFFTVYSVIRKGKQTEVATDKDNEPAAYKWCYLVRWQSQPSFNSLNLSFLLKNVISSNDPVFHSEFQAILSFTPLNTFSTTFVTGLCQYVVTFRSFGFSQDLPSGHRSQFIRPDSSLSVPQPAVLRPTKKVPKAISFTVLGESNNLVTNLDMNQDSVQ